LNIALQAYVICIVVEVDVIMQMWCPEEDVLYVKEDMKRFGLLQVDLWTFSSETNKGGRPKFSKFQMEMVMKMMYLGPCSVG